MWLVVFLVTVACALGPGLGLAGGDPGQPLEKPPREARDAEREGLVLMRDERRIGRSARGRSIEVARFGGSNARRKVLVVGCIHGTECAGIKVARMAPSGCPLPYADLRLVENLNPDGYRRGSRLNARGVDLNRNFASGWRAIGSRGDPQHSGPHPFSEPETRAARRLIEGYRPDVTIWFHQQAEPLVRAWGRSIPTARRYARFAGLPFRPMPWMAGTAPNWQNHRFPGTASFVVELPPGRLSLRDATRHGSAIERIGGYLGENSFNLGIRPPKLRLARPPYAGLACRSPNSSACDRVGLAVALPARKPAVRLQARIEGRKLRMRTPPGHPSQGTYFEGFRRLAGLKRAARDVKHGTTVYVKVQIFAQYADGRWADTSLRVPLAGGWG
jgi:hypothetical protein